MTDETTLTENGRLEEKASSLQPAGARGKLRDDFRMPLRGRRRKHVQAVHNTAGKTIATKTAALAVFEAEFPWPAAVGEN